GRETASETRRLAGQKTDDDRQQQRQQRQQKQQKQQQESQKQKLLKSLRIPIPMRPSCVYMHAEEPGNAQSPSHHSSPLPVRRSPLPASNIQHPAPRSWQSNGQRWTMTFTPFERAKTDKSNASRFQFQFPLRSIST
ncbi:hypothetical protein M5D96_011922, partial [Drosophila gunungcola]